MKKSPKAAITSDHLYVLTEASGSYTLTRYAKDGSGAQPVDTVSANAGGIATDKIPPSSCSPRS